MQWIIAFIIPIFRGFYEWILPKFFNRAAGHQNEASTFFLECNIGCHWAFYVTVRLASADELAENWMFGVEMCINFCYAFQIVFLHNKIQGDMTDEEITKWKTKKQAILRNLVSTEAIEILIPLAYSACYASAYYGPNAKIMAGVRSTYFGMKEGDIKDILQSVFKMAVVDAFGAILIGGLLRLLCQINIFDEFCIIMKKHWITILTIMGSCLIFVRNINKNTN